MLESNRCALRVDEVLRVLVEELPFGNRQFEHPPHLLRLSLFGSLLLLFDARLSLRYDLGLLVGLAEIGHHACHEFRGELGVCGDLHEELVVSGSLHERLGKLRRLDEAASIFGLLAISALDEILEHCDDGRTVLRLGDLLDVLGIPARIGELQLGELGAGQVEVERLGALDTVEIGVGDLLGKHDALLILELKRAA